MSRSLLQPFVHRLRQTLAGGAAAGVSDTQLLERFCAERDETAFELLVRRHAGLVLAVCRRVLGDAHSAEDAFQATFLALVRKAGAVGRRGSVAGWLYQVAYHTAVRAGRTATRRADRERQGVDLAATAALDDPAAEVAARELRPLLDAELSRLPAKYRDPVVLCYLEGKTYDEAARQLGCPKGTVATRLAHARELLRSQLARRGLLLSGGMLAAALAGPSAAAAPAAWVEASLALARSTALGQVAAAPHVLALTEGVLRTMWLTKARLTAVILLTGSLFGLGAGSFALPAPGEQPDSAPKAAAPLAVAAGKQVGEVHCLKGHTAAVQRVAFAPDGRRLLSCGLDGSIRLWDLNTGREIRRFAGHRDRVECVDFSADGRRFLSASWDWTVRLWDVETGQELRRFQFQGAPGVHVSGAWWLPDGRRFLALATDHHSLQIYDAASGALAKDFGRHPGHIYTAALAPDGRRVLEGSYDYAAPLRLWDVASGRLVREFQGYTGETRSVAYSPDGRLALSAGNDVRVRLWDVETGQIARELVGHAAPVSWVAYAPDGRRALSASADQTVRLWNVATGAEQVRFFGHTAGVTCVAFSPDGRYAASGGYDQAVRVWRLPPPFGTPIKPSRPAADDRPAPGGDDQAGEHDWKVAEFYRRTGHPGSAYFAYEVFLRRYPFSPHAKEAKERQCEMQREMEKRQRDLRRELEKAADDLSTDRPS